MSDTLSTLIAFGGFLMVFSMLLQSLQEVVKNLLKLKTGVWERFFKALYVSEFPSEAEVAPPGPPPPAPAAGSQPRLVFKEVSEATVKKALAVTVQLLDPVKKTWSRQTFGDFEKRLRNIQDIVTKADMILTGLRDELYKLRTMVLTKDTFLKDTQPVRDRIREIAALRLDTLLTIFDTYRSNLISDFYGKLNAFERSAIAPNAQSADWESGAASASFKREMDALLESLLTIEREVYDYRVQIESKIDAWLGQINAEYRRNMLKWTVIIGLFLVILSNADSFKLFKYLSLNPKLKAEIIKTVQANKDGAAQEALKIEGADNLAKANAFLKEGKTNDAGNVISELSQALQKSYRDMGEERKATEADAITERTKKILQDAAKPAGGNPSAIKMALERQLDLLSASYIALQASAVDYQYDRLGALDLPLGWSEDGPTISIALKYRQWEVIIKKFGGLLITTLLITFGAPFWNEVMNALLGIRSATKGPRDGPSK